MAAKTLMIQGTGSHVGKSVLVAALCRLFTRRGLRVAPFKAQNMSNNSFVTPDGKEIGRAQAVQAVACRLPPRSDFNPILIKPSGEQDAQLVVNGEVTGSLNSSDFGRIRRECSVSVKDAFARLSEEFDLVVLEGAGSSAEFNLREYDVVNMYMAQQAQAPVLLVGDIDRGGVLASLVGTIALLEPHECRFIKGFIINKFRGELKLLLPGLRVLEDRMQVPCLGVLPYLRDIGLPQEDAVEWTRPSHDPCREDVVMIGVVDVPCLSNFTDFDALACEPDVCIQKIIDGAGSLPHVLIFPGTKNTDQALQFIRARNLHQFATRVLHAGGTVLGICGGYQILGKRILDPEAVESAIREQDGLGLLDVITTFAPKKVTVQVTGSHRASRLMIQGYEVHMGQTIVGKPMAPFLDVKNGNDSLIRPEGVVSADGRVIGTYLHGLFDAPLFRRYFLNAIRSQCGWAHLEAAPSVSLDESLDQWADAVARHIDMPGVEAIIDRGIS